MSTRPGVIERIRGFRPGVPTIVVYRQRERLLVLRPAGETTPRSTRPGSRGRGDDGDSGPEPGAPGPETGP